MAFDLVDVAENGWGLTPAMAAERRDVRDDLILIDQLGPAFTRLAVRLRLDDTGLQDHRHNPAS